jgi:hypothetical protein
VSAGSARAFFVGVGRSSKEIPNPNFRFPLGVGVNAAAGVSSGGKTESGSPTWSSGGCRPEKCYRRDVNMVPLCSTQHFDTTQHAGDADELGVVEIGQWFVWPLFRDCPTPEECGLRALETDPLVNINVKRCSLLGDVARSAADPHHRRMFCRCVVGRRELERFSGGRDVISKGWTHIEDISHKVALIFSIDIDPSLRNHRRIE